MVVNIPPKHEFIFDGVMTRTYEAKAGHGLSKHDHVYAHATVCYAGKLRITKENIDIVLTKDSQPVVLKAGEWHQLEALEDGTIWANVFAEEFMQCDIKAHG